jgi:hypothetical protein
MTSAARANTVKFNCLERSQVRAIHTLYLNSAMSNTSLPT